MRAPYVWPTRWKYAYTDFSDNRILVRIDRTDSGKVYTVSDTGWVPLGQSKLASHASPYEKLSSNDLLNMLEKDRLTIHSMNSKYKTYWDIPVKELQLIDEISQRNKDINSELVSRRNQAEKLRELASSYKMYSDEKLKEELASIEKKISTYKPNTPDSYSMLILEDLYGKQRGIQQELAIRNRNSAQ